MNNSLDLGDILNAALTLAAFLGGWLMKLLFSRIDKLEAADAANAASVNAHISRLEDVDAELVNEVAQTRLDLAKNYVPKTDLQHIVAPIYETLRRIEDKLDRKADKDSV